MAAKILETVVYKELEPVIIDEKLLKQMMGKAFKARYKNESLRLAELVRLDLNSVTQIRLEISTITRIQNLNLLPNLELLSLCHNQIEKIENLNCLTKLKDLNLAFNNIERIENLEKLKMLTNLSLYGNKIERIENLEDLDQVTILSLGRNKINTIKGLEKLRTLKNLFSINLEENPIVKVEKFQATTFIRYISAILPQLRFYAGHHIFSEDRKKGITDFRSEIQELEEFEKSKALERSHRLEEETKMSLYSKCFTEHLLGDQLFESMFRDDQDGQALLAMGDVERTVFVDYKLSVWTLTEQMLKISLQQQERREEEVLLLKECVEHARKSAQVEGQKNITFLLTKKTELFTKLTKDIKLATKSLKLTPDEATESNKFLMKIDKDFQDWLNEVQNLLTENENFLFAGVQDVLKNFNHAIQDLMTEFLEKMAAKFATLRETELAFMEKLVENVQNAFNFKYNIDDVPDLLKTAPDDRDLIPTVAAGMHDTHNQKIDDAEEKCVRQLHEWANQLADTLNSEEIERHHSKKLEIEKFCDMQEVWFGEFGEAVLAKIHQ